MDTPLLASEADSSVPPSLSSGPVEAEVSEFSRLIAQVSTPIVPTLALFRTTAQGPATNKAGACRVIIAGTLTLLHLGFVWGALMSNAWWETDVKVSVDWQKRYLPSLDDITEFKTSSTNLASLLQSLESQHKYILMCLLWISSLLLPCLFMIASPAWIIGDATQEVGQVQRQRLFNIRTGLELSMRFSLFIIYLYWISFHAVSWRIEWTAGSVLSVRTTTMSGMSAYIVGVTSAMGTIVALRWPYIPYKVPMQFTRVVDEAPNPPRVPVRTPPPHAFRLLWPSEGRESPANHMTVLEDTPRSPPAPSRHANDDRSSITTPSKRLHFCTQVALYQLGLVSVLLWVPAAYLPLLRITYHGLLGELISERKLYLSDLFVYKDEPSVGAIVAMTALLFPLIATCLAVCSWIAPFKYKCRGWLYTIQPLVATAALVVALFSSLPHEYVQTEALLGGFFLGFEAFVLEAFILCTLRLG